MRDDEAEERLRQERERGRLSPLDRLYGKPAVGLQGLRRRGRVIQMHAAAGAGDP
jgi:hypothetical protein